ncbi:CDGSH iron-sulfur domain-containing protein [Actinomadura atramentaria]|uniref:CDGSH iron-sulfur domain-containing protein n=1 Tax=Actinomadura atramentaria TaxID=1990 RepID=UPI0004764CA2
MTAVENGPLLVEGPVDIVLDDGSVARSDRFVVALCACRRSRNHPFCDTSHRGKPRRRQAAPAGSAGSADSAGSSTGRSSDERDSRQQPSR